MTDGMNWIRAKTCEELVDMEKNKLITEFLHDMDGYLDSNYADKNSAVEVYWSKIKEKWEKRL